MSPAIAQIQSTNALLDYSLTTAPEPLQVSADATQPSMATLTIVVSNSGDDVTLTSLEIALPVGIPSAPEGADLTEVGAGIAGSSSDPAWQVTYPGQTDGVLWVQPKGGKPIVIGNQGIAITITNIAVSTEPGTAFVTITESATVTVTGAAPAGEANVVLAVPKFPIAFAAGNFSIATPVISNGATSTLTWFGTQGTGYTYTILWTGAPVDVSTVQTWTSPALTSVTTFLLEVQGTTPNGPVKLWFSTTQVVSSPNIVAGTLEVLGQTTLGGDTALSAAASEVPLNLLDIDIAGWGTEPNAQASAFIRARDIGAEPPQGATYFVVRGDGLVGIGTATPTARLTVGGTLHVTENATFDGTMLGPSMVPVGSVMSYAGSTDALATSGWLVCDGSQITATEYPLLVQALGNIYGGDGVTTACVPDMRGQFVRGVDGGSGVDPDVETRNPPPDGVGVGVGSTQVDALANHQHDWDYFFYWFTYSGSDIACHQPSDSRHLQTNTRAATNNDGGVKTGSSGVESRPKNIALYWIIRAL